VIYNGHTWELTTKERAINELQSCKETLAQAKTDSERRYWQHRLELAEKHLEEVSNVG